MKTEMAILIDCWQGHHGRQDIRTQMCQNIAAFLTARQLDLVVVATYAHDDIPAGPQGTHPILNSALQTLQSDWIYITQFQQLCNKVDCSEWQMQKIWFFGLHWNKCLALRELGFMAIGKWAKKTWPEIEILFRDDCTLDLRYLDDQFLIAEEFWPNLAKESWLTTPNKKLRPHTWKLKRVNPITQSGIT